MAPLPEPPPQDRQFKWISFSGAAGNPFSVSMQNGMALPSQSRLGAGEVARSAEQVGRCYLGSTALLGLGRGGEGREVSRNLLRGDRCRPAPSSIRQHPSSSPVYPCTAFHTPSSSHTRPLGPEPCPMLSDSHPIRWKWDRVSQANSC